MRTHKMKKLLLFTFIFIMIISTASAYTYRTIYNPFTSRLDYHITSNMTGENITADYFIGDGSLLINLASSSIPDIWVNITGDIMLGNLNMSGNKLTDVGELIMQGVITSQDVIPYTTDLYSLGNSTNWFDELWVRTIHSDDIFTTNLNASNINTTNLNAEDIGSENVNISQNLTIGGNVIKQDGNDLTLILTG